MQAVPAAEVLAALQDGRDVELMGVTVSGDLIFEALPEIPIARVTAATPALKEAMELGETRTARVLTGAFTMKESRVSGSIKTGTRTRLLVAAKPVDFSGTRFEQTVDWSNTVFLAPVEMSQAVFLREALFLNCLFAQRARFDRTAFGFHTRFHRAQFHGPASFLRAGFNGLSEFLEVTFAQDVTLSRAYFKLGTGFSGSRFGGMLDFSEALFEQDAYFRRATFRGTADFSDAEFRRLGDFAKVLFDAPPLMTRTKLAQPPQGAGGLEDPRTLYVIATLLLIFTLALALFLRKT
jgi:hypothetical protein